MPHNFLFFVSGASHTLPPRRMAYTPAIIAFTHFLIIISYGAIIYA